MPPLLAPIVDAYKEQQASLGRDVGDELALAELLLKVHRDKPLLTNEDGARVPVTGRDGAPVTLGMRVQQAQQQARQTPRAQANALKKVVGKAPTELRRFVKYLERERARNKDPRRAAKVAAARAAMCQAKLDQMQDALQAFVSAGILQADVLTQHAPCETWGRVLIAITEAERAGTLPRGMVTVDQAELAARG